MNDVCSNRFCRVLVWVPLLVLVLAQAAVAQSKFTVRDWMRLDSGTKLGVMKVFIEKAKEDKVILRLPAEYYVKELDLTVSNAYRNNDLGGLNSSVSVVIHTIAAMEGDWDNGENKIEHAKKLMGPEQFEFFKQAYPEKYKHLEAASSSPIQQTVPTDRQETSPASR